mmetsp:Transcript_49298/g.117294  ORF Transcript_49298/g.117294 Transcript_49298/m.117294 type:complete len:440 (+) Transcript_49298:99-1418(+)|eukprot:CAMPEP_0178391440 /NCGR_PEP_ID=MMETSP0689_2-20121128/11165_1 /TAXON_ID=160604 /ORGANISM="Amphidinium massartii, Strain CS-259" /LENGTH=439 /DNA_ID=CAMNT_0020011985 /DNA_START=54 /DNA_END=1373 /DNA_ORIENTATION=+
MWNSVTDTVGGAQRNWTFNLVERLCYPSPESTYTRDTFPSELIEIPKGNGKVPCLFLPFQHARFVVIYFHANGEDLGSSYAFCCGMREQLQVNVLAIEYPGYGICGGYCSEAGILDHASIAMDFVINSVQWPLDGIKLLGRSLGTGPAIAMATKYNVAGVILIAPFLSIREVFRPRIGKLADLLEDRFQNGDIVHKIRTPTLIIHGTQDRLVPKSHSITLYEKLVCRKMLVCPEDKDHNFCLLKELSTFILPMVQFFSLPDYVFEEFTIPDWAWTQASVHGPSMPTTDSRPPPPEDPRLRPPVPAGAAEFRRLPPDVHMQVANENGFNDNDVDERLAGDTAPVIKLPPDVVKARHFKTQPAAALVPKKPPLVQQPSYTLQMAPRLCGEDPMSKSPEKNGAGEVNMDEVRAYQINMAISQNLHAFAWGMLASVDPDCDEV